MPASIVTADVVLDKRRAKTNGEYPLKLRITYQRIQRYYKTKLSATEAIWQEVEDGRRAKQHNDLRDAITAIKTKLSDVLRSFEKKELPFDFAMFEQFYFGQELQPIREREQVQDVYGAWERYIRQLHDEGRVSTALAYNDAFQSLKKFRPVLRFRDITPTLLTAYENWMLGQGRSVSTIGIYVRGLRIIVGQALESGVITSKEYPFGKRRYQIPASKNVKKALSLELVRAIREYPVEAGSNEERNRDLWLFSYLSNGINPKDIFRLRWGDVDGDMIRLYRKKTLRTSRSNPRRIDIVISEPMQHIIEKWGNPNRSPDGPMFPLFSSGLTPTEWEYRARDLVKQINRCTKRIGQALGIPFPVTSYVARHSYASIMRRSGISPALISENLGHANLRTTENYYDSFEDEVKRKAVSALL